MTNRIEGSLEKYFRDYVGDPDFIAEGIAVAIMEDALKIMKNKGLSRSDLANLMGVKKAHVSRLFNAPPNLTLRSLARLAVALGVKPIVRFDVEARELSSNQGDVADVNCRMTKTSIS